MGAIATAADPVERTWTNVGGKWVADGDRPRVLRYIERMTWEGVEGNKPMMPALGIKAAIKELRIPRVDLIAISADMAPYGLYGIQAHYTNGRVRVYLVDSGCGVTPIMSERWED